MTKVADIVKDALEHLGVIDTRQPVQAADMQTGIRALNMMMRTWEAIGLSLGWKDVDNPSDDIPSPPEADQAIGYALAVILAPRFQTPVSAELASLAASSIRSLRAQQAMSEYARVRYDDLPVGTSWNGDWRWGFGG